MLLNIGESIRTKNVRRRYRNRCIDHELCHKKCKCKQRFKSKKSKSYSKKRLYEVQNNLIISNDTNEKDFSSLDPSIPYSQKLLFKIRRINLLNKKKLKITL